MRPAGVRTNGWRLCRGCLGGQAFCRPCGDDFLGCVHLRCRSRVPPLPPYVGGQQHSGGDEESSVLERGGPGIAPHAEERHQGNVECQAFQQPAAGPECVASTRHGRNPRARWVLHDSPARASARADGCPPRSLLRRPKPCPEVTTRDTAALRVPASMSRRPCMPRSAGGQHRLASRSLVVRCYQSGASDRPTGSGPAAADASPSGPWTLSSLGYTYRSCGCSTKDWRRAN